MAIPRQCHKDIRGDEKQYCVETIHTLKKYTFYNCTAKVLYFFEMCKFRLSVIAQHKKKHPRNAQVIFYQVIEAFIQSLLP